MRRHSGLWMNPGFRVLHLHDKAAIAKSFVGGDFVRVEDRRCDHPCI